MVGKNSQALGRLKNRGAAEEGAAEGKWERASLSRSPRDCTFLHNASANLLQLIQKDFQEGLTEERKV
jgi:hypothetical protein